MRKYRLTWKIGGEAGYGIMTTGLIFSKTFSRGGLFVFDTTEYPSLIRGGHSTYTVRVEDEPIFSHIKPVDILVALTKETVDRHKNEVSKNGSIIYDDEIFKIEKDEVRSDINLYPIPLIRLATEAGGSKLMQNNVALGATMALIDYDINLLFGVIKDVFGGKKGEEIANFNIKVATAGYDFIRNNFKVIKKLKIEPIQNSPKRMYLTGNEAIALGALKAGCKFYAAYPMTPASSILHYMAAKEFDYNIVVKQTEDEIAAIHMAIGASFAGVRSMTATSGGGFSLMTEALGLAAITETPLVVVLAQRPGPSTGMPTHTEQGDLRFVMHASNGEFPRIVIAPGDTEECFYETFNAFNLAERYQMPVIIITDKFLAESHRTTDFFDLSNMTINRGQMINEVQLKEVKDFKRYENTLTGIPWRSIPSQQGAIFKAATDEHDEYGRLCEEPNERTKQVDRRFRKMKVLESEIDGVKTYGHPDAEITLISWGSTKGPILEAMKLFEQEKIKIKFVQVVYISPFPTRKIKSILEDSEKIILIENNKTGQLGGVIREFTGMDIHYKILKYDGRPFTPEDIYEKVKEAWEFDKL